MSTKSYRWQLRTVLQTYFCQHISCQSKVVLVYVVLVFCGFRYVEIPLLIGAGNLAHSESELDSLLPPKNNDTTSCNPPNEESCELVCRILWVDDSLGLLLHLHMKQQKFLRQLAGTVIINTLLQGKTVKLPFSFFK